MELYSSRHAVYTTARSEKKVKIRLDEAKVNNYQPLHTEYRMWSDRRKILPGHTTALRNKLSVIFLWQKMQKRNWFCLPVVT